MMFYLFRVEVKVVKSGRRRRMDNRARKSSIIGRRTYRVEGKFLLILKSLLNLFIKTELNCELHNIRYI